MYLCSTLGLAIASEDLSKLYRKRKKSTMSVFCSSQENLLRTIFNWSRSNPFFKNSELKFNDRLFFCQVFSRTSNRSENSKSATKSNKIAIPTFLTKFPLSAKHSQKNNGTIMRYDSGVAAITMGTIIKV